MKKQGNYNEDNGLTHAEWTDSTPIWDRLLVGKTQQQWVPISVSSSIIGLVNGQICPSEPNAFTFTYSYLGQICPSSVFVDRGYKMDRFVPQNQYILLHLLFAFSAFYKMEGFIMGNPTSSLVVPPPPGSVSNSPNIGYDLAKQMGIVIVSGVAVSITTFLANKLWKYIKAMRNNTSDALPTPPPSAASGTSPEPYFTPRIHPSEFSPSSCNIN